MTDKEITQELDTLLDFLKSHQANSENQKDTMSSQEEVRELFEDEEYDDEQPIDPRSVTDKALLIVHNLLDGVLSGDVVI